MGNRLFHFEAGFATHAGRVRDRNEDAYVLRSDAGLWAVADGMGGHDAGDVASRLVADALASITIPESAVALLEQCEGKVFEANREILELSRQRGGLIIGSTVVILLISEDHYACVWAGDSRLYRSGLQAISQVSRDHTEVEELLASGALTAEEASHWPNNVITRAIGVRDIPELEVVTNAFEMGDAFLLCSDGLTKHVTDQEIFETMSTSEAQAACDKLVELALARGGLDNVTVVVVRPKRRDDAPEHIQSHVVREPTIVPGTSGDSATDPWE